MPAPANADELLDLIQKSGVVDESKLRAYIQKLTDTTGLPQDPAKFAGYLVRDGILTYFQAEQLLQGKYKRFSIGKYKVLEKLGAGGMAQVFLCEHKLMRRRVAIKVLPTAKADDPSSLGRFRREAAAIAAVDHPNIVRAYDIDQDDNLHFLVMEYVDGTNLQDLIKKFGPLDITRACHYVYGAAVGLQHAHEKGLIHRDIKPGNILIDRAGVVKILDMGLARFFHDEEDAITKKYDENVLGTADYLAPEQALDSHTVDIRADIYSLGATFYYLLTASALFPEGSVAQKLIWHQNRMPRPVRSLRSEVPEEISAIVERMMAKDVANRFQTPAEIMAALAPWVTTPIPPPSEREMPQISLAAGGSAGQRQVSTQTPQKGSDAVRGLLPLRPDAPTVVASVPRTPAQPFPLSPAIGSGPSTPTQSTLPTTVDAHPAVWESLDSDTQSAVKDNTDRPIKQPDPESRRFKTSSPSVRGKGPLILVVVGVFLFLGAAVGVYFAFLNKKPIPVTPINKHIITVSNEPGDSNVPRLSEALSRVEPGDTIVISIPKLTEQVLKLTGKKHKDVTIESGLPDGKVPVIEFIAPKSGIHPGAFLTIESVEGFRLKNVEFDCKNGIQTGILITGSCPGLSLEKISVQNAVASQTGKSGGIVVQNAAGEESRPIVFERIRTFGIGNKQNLTDGCGLLLTASSNLETKWIKIRNSRFEGPCKDGIGIDGATVGLEIFGNRFFNLDTAISLQPREKPTKAVQIVSSTICMAKTGIVLDVSPPPPIPNQPPIPAGKIEGLSILQNYFADTAEIGKVNGVNTPVPGLTARDNGKSPTGCNDGNMGFPLPTLQSPLLSKDPNDDGKFLRFPGGPQPIPPGSAKVGAP